MTHVSNKATRWSQRWSARARARRWWFGALAEIKAGAADTGGQMTIIEVTEHPGAEAPLHVHHRDDEGFWILEGDVTFEVGDTTIEASAGDYVFGPRDIPHRFTVGDRGCRMLFILMPGGIEDLIQVTSEPAPTRTLRRHRSPSRPRRRWSSSSRPSRSTATSCSCDSRAVGAPQSGYLYAMPALAGPASGRTSVRWNPTSLHHSAKSAPV